MGGRTSYGQTSSQGTTAPWSAQQPYIQQGMAEAASQLTGPSTVAGFSPQTQAGLGMTQQIAGSQSLPTSASSFLEAMLGGAGLSPTAWMGGGASAPAAPAATGGGAPAPSGRPVRPSFAGMPIGERQAARADWRSQMDAWRAAGRGGAAPGAAPSVPSPTAASEGNFQNAYIDQLAQSIGNKVIPGVMGQFGMAGRSGSSPLAEGAVATGIADSLAPYMFGSAENQMGRMFSGYQNERDRQMQALGLSPGIAQAEYGPASAMLGAGSMYDQLAQAQLNNPAEKLGNFMNIVGQPFGSQTSSTGTAPIAHESGFAPLRIFGK